MKAVTYLTPAVKALARHRADSARIRMKIAAHAANPAAQANNIKRLKGRRGVVRLRVGDYRVLLVEDAESITVLDIGPRGSVYD